MKIVVCGGRDFSDRAQLDAFLDQLHCNVTITELVEGGCPTGADFFAREWVATKPEIRWETFEAEWKKYGRAAGPLRNTRMAEWKPDLVVAAPGGKGTADMVRKARAAGIPVRKIRP